jgi:acetyl esterase/lipase
MDFSKYGETLAPELVALLDRSPELATLGFEVENPLEMRKNTNAQREALALKMTKVLGLDKVVQYSDHTVPTSDGQSITLREYRPVRASEKEKIPALVYYHGGGMLFGSINSEIATCSRLADAVGMTVMHVCYRHTPEFKHPTQHNDAWEGFEWVLAHAAELNIDTNHISVGGASAGGTLAASVTLAEVTLAKKTGRKLRLQGQILAIPVLIWHKEYPWELLVSREKCSKVQNSQMPTLPLQKMDLFADLYGATDPKDPLHNFLFAAPDVLAAMPKTVIIAHGSDILRDEDLLYAKTLEKLE